MEFTNKTVVITGAARGMGFGAAEAFAKEGANVVLVDLSKDAVEEAAKKIGLTGERYLAVGADVSSSNDVHRYVEEALNKFGKVDVLFSNAGISGRDKPLVDITDEEFNRCIDVNLKGCFYALREMIPVMRKQGGGSIVINAALGALRVLPFMTEYAAAKSGMISLMRSAAVENAQYNIRVNAICPGPIKTAMLANFEIAQGINDENRAEKLAQILPMKRYGSLEELADLVVFLGSDRSTYINGETIRIDGGLGI